jgi:preprotein translocase subunit SecA
VLVGTVSIAKSEVVSGFLKKRGVPHNVLNAKQHQREADIVAQAGRKGAVTISTNMAGRGTDILLGGNPEVMTKAAMGPEPTPPEPVDGQPVDPAVLAAYEQELAEYKKKFDEKRAFNEELTKKEREEVVAAGGLFIVGTERHESRRIDNQLRGRAGRQGDPGVSRFYLSLEDDLMRIFGSERIQGLMERLGMEEGEVIEHKWLSRAIEGAQKRVEGHNFDIRKNLLEYDDVMNQQRRTIYKLRRQVLAAGAGIPLVEYDEDKKTKAKIRTEKTVSWADFKEMVLDSLEDSIVTLTDTYLPTKNPATWDLEALQRNVKDVYDLEMSFEAAGDRETVENDIYKAAEKIITQREQEFGEDFLRFLQYRYLATIDQLWKDHLLAMDHLRQGIGLRGYGQKDPKQEYKKEGYNGFIQMLGAIKTQFVSQMMRVQARANTAEETARIQRQMAQRQKQAHEGRANEEGKLDEASLAPKAPAKAEGPRVGRNDPCPCGSGRKYKKCHGAAEANV